MKDATRAGSEEGRLFSQAKPKRTFHRNNRNFWQNESTLARVGSRSRAKRLLESLGESGTETFWSFHLGSFSQGKSVADVVQIGSRTEKMFPSHLSVNDLGVFAVVMVFGLIVVLLFMFDFVSTAD